MATVLVVSSNHVTDCHHGFREKSYLNGNSQLGENETYFTTNRWKHQQEAIQKLQHQQQLSEHNETAARTSGNCRTIFKMTICQHAEVVAASLLWHMGFSDQTRKQQCHYTFLIGFALVNNVSLCSGKHNTMK